MSKLTKIVPADQIFRAFSDTTRLRILHLLLEGELCVCDVIDIIRVPQPTASRHLAYLRRMGLVTTRRQGAWIYYALTPARTALQRKLWECLRLCSDHLQEIRADTVKIRARKKSPNSCC